MNGSNIDKWRKLIDQLEGNLPKGSLCTVEQIQKAEQDLGFEFPEGFREFCLTFGSGSFGVGEYPNEFYIYGVSDAVSRFDIRSIGYMLTGLKITYDTGDLAEASMGVAEHLLEYGYPFGSSPNGDSFLWDLASCTEHDHSYDIYWIPGDQENEIRQVGRDFYAFIDQFCLGLGLKTMFDLEYDLGAGQKRFFHSFDEIDSSEDDTNFIEESFEEVWNNISSSPLYSHDTEVSLTFSINAPNKEKCDCILRSLEELPHTKIEIISASDRRSIPRLIEVGFARKEITRELTYELLRKMIEIASKCGCSLESWGVNMTPNKP